MPKLGVNIDHVATVRQVRKGIEPEPVLAALICQSNGADSIVVHLREDRRHINDRDLCLLKKAVKKRLNLEMSIAGDIVAIACKIKPDQATLVPEKRQEVTTEGGLDVAGNLRRIQQVVRRLEHAGIKVSLFIDPEKKQIDASEKSGVKIIELHTGRFAEAKDSKEQKRYFRELVLSCKYALKKGFVVNAGHGLNYFNVKPIAGIKGIEELNIGYAIVCRAVLVGLGPAVRQMKELIS